MVSTFMGCLRSELIDCEVQMNIVKCVQKVGVQLNA